MRKCKKSKICFDMWTEDYGILQFFRYIKHGKYEVFSCTQIGSVLRAEGGYYYTYTDISDPRLSRGGFAKSKPAAIKKVIALHEKL